MANQNLDQQGTMQPSPGMNKEKEKENCVFILVEGLLIGNATKRGKLFYKDQM